MYKVIIRTAPIIKETKETCFVTEFRSFKKAYEFAFSNIEDYIDNDYDVTFFEAYKSCDKTGTKEMGYCSLWNLVRDKEGYSTESFKVTISVEKVIEGETYTYIS